MTKDQFTADFIRVLRSGAKIAAGKEKTAGEARDMINKLRAEIEADKREGR
jgi:hypothetical protein